MIAERAASENGSVPPSSVHKRDPDSVWIHHPRPQVGNDLHLEFSYPDDFTSARLVDLIEVQRQAGMYFMHSLLGVPEGRVFILSSISLERSLWQFERHLDAQAAGGAIVVREYARDVWASPQKAPTELAFKLFANTGAAAGAATVRAISQRAYDRVRRTSATPAKPLTGSVHADYVGAIVLDRLDPLLSDHASDHVSAMAVLASLERSVLSFGSLRVDALSAEFRRYIEEGEDATYRLSFGADGVFSGIVEQSAAVCATFMGSATVRAIRGAS